MKLKKMERYLRVNLLGPGPCLLKKKGIYRAAVSQTLRNTGLQEYATWSPSTRPQPSELRNMETSNLTEFGGTAVHVPHTLSMMTALVLSSCAPSLDSWWPTFWNTAMSPLSTVECAGHLNLPQGNTKPWRNTGHTSPSDAVQYLGRTENKWVPLQKLPKIRLLII